MKSLASVCDLETNSEINSSELFRNFSLSTANIFFQCMKFHSRFHVCKTDEHRLICSHERVPCINAGYGCPHWMQRRFLAEHLPYCPASVIICNAEWNRWALGAKEREKVAMAKGVTALYDSTDLGK